MTPHLVIYTTVYGAPETAQVRLAFHQAVFSFARDVNISWLDSRSFANVGELSAARSRAARMALAVPTMTHLLSWDEDVAGDRIARCLHGMLMSGHPIVGVPYPKKTFHWDRVVARARELAATPERITREALEAVAYDYSYRLTQRFAGEPIDAHRCARVDGVGCGFMLTSRSALERMTERYHEATGLTYKDDFDDIDTVGLFMPLITNGTLLNDDFAFCERASTIGIPTHLYLGEGAPLDHYGSFAFRGQASALVDDR